MLQRDIMAPQFNWLSQVVEHFESRGYQPNVEADNVAHTILTPEESKVSDEIRELLYLTLPIRFWVKTEQTETCWLWNGRTVGKGYGYLRWRGVDTYTHRLVWSIVNGQIPPRMNVCHKCDNPPCFNPSHLFLGTYADNNADCRRKGRHYSPFASKRGEERPNAKLTSNQVREIKMELSNGGTVRGIARRYKVGRSTINSIRMGLNWSHIKIDSAEES